MGFLILLFIIGLPLIEIYLFIEVGEQIGALSTVGLTVLTAILGMSLVRSQGLGVARRAEASKPRLTPIINPIETATTATTMEFWVPVINMETMSRPN